MDNKQLQRIYNIQSLNIKLSNVLIDVTTKLINFSKTNNIKLPSDVEPLLKEVYAYMHELKNQPNINKTCFIQIAHNKIKIFIKATRNNQPVPCNNRRTPRTPTSIWQIVF